MNPASVEDLESLLQPIAQDNLCGPSIRYEPMFTEIRMAREEDDPSLPMRQWERPLKKADWPLIETLCETALTKQSKDLQLAVWLTEAWMRQYGLAGLEKGLGLLYDLSYRFWDNIHPEIEDGDCDARIAPFDWLNESISLSMRIHIVLITVFERLPSRITLAEWDKLTSEEVSEQDPLQQKHDEKVVEHDVEPINRAELLMLTRSPSQIGPLKAQLESVRESQTIVQDLKTLLDEKLGMDSPNLNKLIATLQAFERVLDAMTLTPKVQETTAADSPMLEGQAPETAEEGAIAMSDELDVPASGAVHGGPWRSREEAYATLEAVAAYLQKREPHSPTPYLIKKAVRWGRLPLPELMQEIMREEGDLNRLTQLFNIENKVL